MNPDDMRRMRQLAGMNDGDTFGLDNSENFKPNEYEFGNDEIIDTEFDRGYDFQDEFNELPRRVRMHHDESLDEDHGDTVAHDFGHKRVGQEGGHEISGNDWKGRSGPDYKLVNDYGDNPLRGISQEIPEDEFDADLMFLKISENNLNSLSEKEIVMLASFAIEGLRHSNMGIFENLYTEYRKTVLEEGYKRELSRRKG